MAPNGGRGNGGFDTRAARKYAKNMEKIGPKALCRVRIDVDGLKLNVCVVLPCLANKNNYLFWIFSWSKAYIKYFGENS